MQNRRDDFLNTIRGIPSKRPIIWLMRQAGRFLESYREVKKKYTFLEMCTNPMVAAEVTMLPLELGVDALILFSDILIPLLVFDARVHYEENKPPLVKMNLKSMKPISDVRRKLEFVGTTVKMVKDKVDGFVLLGFAGAPFTVACYLLGGGKSFYKVRRFIYRHPEEFKSIMKELTAVTVDYLAFQIESGCDVVQLFDSWAGILSSDLYDEFVAPYNIEIARAVDAPVIYYSHSSEHLGVWRFADAFDCLGVDYRSDMKGLSIRTGKCTQGNLDNVALFADFKTIKRKAVEILESMRGRPHIFNVGEGLLPQTSERAVRYLVEVVHGFK